MNVKGDEPKGSVQNPYTIEEFEELFDNGEWEGGFVAQLGYVAKGLTIYGTEVLEYYGEYLSFEYGLAENIGVTATFIFRAYCSINNEILSISGIAESQRGDFIYTASAELRVNGQTISITNFTTQGEIIYSSGTYPLGFCDIVLKDHIGLVEVVMHVTGTYDSGLGLVNVGASRIVYSQNR